MAEVIPFRHVLAVLSGNAAQSIVPCKGREAMLPALLVDERMDTFSQFMNADPRLRLSGIRFSPSVLRRIPVLRTLT